MKKKVLLKIVVSALVVLGAAFFWVVNELNESIIDEVSLADQTTARVQAVRADAAVYYDGNAQSYLGLCDDLSGYLAQLEAADCLDTETTYRISVPVPGIGQYVCSDQKGYYNNLESAPTELSCSQ